VGVGVWPTTPHPPIPNPQSPIPNPQSPLNNIKYVKLYKYIQIIISIINKIIILYLKI
jgi:hypothetical protein